MDKHNRIWLSHLYGRQFLDIDLISVYMLAILSDRVVSPNVEISSLVDAIATGGREQSQEV